MKRELKNSAKITSMHYALTQQIDSLKIELEEKNEEYNTKKNNSNYKKLLTIIEKTDLDIIEFQQSNNTKNTQDQNHLSIRIKLKGESNNIINFLQQLIDESICYIYKGISFDSNNKQSWTISLTGDLYE